MRKITIILLSIILTSCATQNYRWKATNPEIVGPIQAYKNAIYYNEQDIKELQKKLQYPMTEDERNNIMYKIELLNRAKDYNTEKLKNAHLMHYRFWND